MNFSWIVMNYNCNTNKIEPYDVLKYRVDWMKKLKRTAKNKKEFSDLLEREMMYHYWSRAEYELILVKCNSKLWLKPWCGCRNPEEVKIDVTNENFWQEFAEQYNNWWDNEAKIDIYDQLRFKWNEFVDYCWNTYTCLMKGEEKMHNESYDKVSDTNKLTEEFKLDTALCYDPERIHKQNELFNFAEHWLNYLGIKTRTEYGNLLPTYNLFLEIGEYLQRRLTEENDE